MIPLRILHTESSLGWGGQEIRILSEAEGLRDRGHQLSLACSPRSKLYKVAKDRGLNVYPLPLARLRPWGVAALRRHLQRHPVDIVNTHSSVDSWTTALALLGWKTRPAVVRTRHLGIAVSRRRSTRWLYQVASDRIVATGERVRTQLIEENGFSPSSIVAVPTGIDETRFHPADRGHAQKQLKLQKGRLLLGFVATIRGGKGLQTLFDAMAQTPAGKAWHLVVVGDGPMAEVFRDLRLSLGLKESVTMVGHQDDVAPYLKSFDALALPSKVREGVPQAIVQAMMCALPIVSTPMGSIVDAIEDGRSGLLVPPQDPEALGAALMRLAEDETLRDRIGKAARARALERFLRDVMLTSMETVFRNLRKSTSSLT